MQLSFFPYLKSRGFSLIDVLIAMLLFTLTTSGLIQYQQVLMFRFNYYSESQQLLALAQQIVNNYPAKISLLQQNWQQEITTISVDNQCQQINVRVISVKGIKAAAIGLYCQK